MSYLLVWKVGIKTFFLHRKLVQFSPSNPCRSSKLCTGSEVPPLPLRGAIVPRGNLADQYPAYSFFWWLVNCTNTVVVTEITVVLVKGVCYPSFPSLQFWFLLSWGSFSEMAFIVSSGKLAVFVRGLLYPYSLKKKYICGFWETLVLIFTPRSFWWPLIETFIRTFGWLLLHQVSGNISLVSERPFIITLCKLWVYFLTGFWRVSPRSLILTASS